jgi:hypothetical protein
MIGTGPIDGDRGEHPALERHAAADAVRDDGVAGELPDARATRQRPSVERRIGTTSFGSTARLVRVREQTRDGQIRSL